MNPKIFLALLELSLPLFMEINPAVKQDYSLKSSNTFALEAKAQYFAQADSVACLKSLLLSYPHNPKFILGAGSNILFTQDFPGLIIQTIFSGIAPYKNEEDALFLEVGAGEPWENIIEYTIEKELYGLENLTLIPGTIGGACVQNIGAYGMEFQEVVEWVKVYDILEQKEKILSKEACQFGYRQSLFKHHPELIILSAGLRLRKTSCFRIQYPGIQEEITKRGVSLVRLQDMVDIIRTIRRSKLPDPKELGNAGSFFKNPVIPLAHYERLQKSYPKMPSYPEGKNHRKVPAGWLIDQCGWKGKRTGNCGVYEHQALILVNYGNSTGKEILQLSQNIQSSVQKKFDIALETEVVII